MKPRVAHLFARFWRRAAYVKPDLAILCFASPLRNGEFQRTGVTPRGRYCPHDGRLEFNKIDDLKGMADPAFVMQKGERDHPMY